MTKKRILALLLSLCLLLAAFPATALAAGGMPFTDVKAKDWFFDDVEYVYENGLMAGTGKTTFSPKTTTTRGMIVTILYRLEGEPAVSGGKAFPDVKVGAFYTDAVAWASRNDIVAGYSNGKFGPNDNITREQMAVFLYRYSAYKGYDVSSYADLSRFPDASKVGGWAWSQLSWANAMGLIQGKGNGQLAPGGQATRSEAASILARFCRNIISPVSYYKVAFDLNYPGAGALPSQTVEAGKTASTPASPSREGYTFDGWYTAAQGGARFDFNTAITADTTLYAHWTERTVSSHMVTFHLNYPSAGVLHTESVKPGQTVPAPANPSREGYSFAGWYTQPEGGDRYSFDAAVTADMTLYAHWVSAETYTVSFDLNYPGSGVYKQESVVSGNTCPAPSDPRRGDYLFGGWYTDATDGNLYDFTAPVTGDITLYAHWVYDGVQYINPYQKSDYVNVYEGNNPLNFFNMMGRPYYQGLTFTASYSSSDTEALYSLEGKYEMLAFDLGALDNNGSNAASLRIYADGTLLDTIELTWNMATIHYTLNVHDVTQLRFERSGRSSYGYGMANTIPYTAADLEKEGLTAPATHASQAVLDTNLSAGEVLPYQNTDYIDLYDGSDVLRTFTMMGIGYDQGLTMVASYSSNNTEFQFNLGGEFEQFSAVLGHLDNYSGADATLHVYADGEFVEDLALDYNMASYTYTLNVHGVNQLRFERVGRSAYGYGMADITLYTADRPADPALTTPLTSSKVTVLNTNLSAGKVLPYQNTDYITLYDGSDVLRTFSMMGIGYDQGLTMVASYSSNDTGFSFNLGGGFEQFSAVLGHLDNYGGADATLHVYADGEFVEKLALDYNMASYTYTLNVHGVNQLRFERVGRSDYGYGMADITLYTPAEPADPELTTPLASSKATVLNTNLSAGKVLPYQNTDYITLYDGSDVLRTFSMMGNAYSQGVAMVASYSSNNTGFSFNLGGGFHQFSATLGHLDDHGTAAATLRVYADGELVGQIDLTGNMANRSYTLDVEGVNQLRFERVGNSNYGYGMADVSLS